MVQPNHENDGVRAIERAIILVTEALDLLDAHADCADASAHLDLSLRCMRQSLASKAPTGR